ncbi:class I SAM-dependent methyltransferase [Clostridiaceae bacterium M8S5]|nr:class I SAM-dependent methyltransferase [Clostridiaceae bacterium M8S5]
MSFYEEIARYYEYIFPLKQDKLDFVLSQRKGKILDIGCSTGELALALNKEGYEVIGIDLDEKMINIAKKKEISKLKFYHLNMMDIEKFFKDDKFDQITCLGNTLVHLKSTDSILNFFNSVKKLLVEDGVFKFQILNYDKILEEKIQYLPKIENTKIKFIRRYKYTPDKIIFETELYIKEENKTLTGRVDLIPVKKKQIINLLNEAGFNKITYYSGFDKRPYTINALPLVFEVKI